MKSAINISIDKLCLAVDALVICQELWAMKRCTSRKLKATSDNALKARADLMNQIAKEKRAAYSRGKRSNRLAPIPTTSNCA